jgi:hypothetical protein
MTMTTKTKGQGGAPSLALLAVALLAGGCGPRAGARDAGAAVTVVLPVVDAASAPAPAPLPDDLEPAPAQAQGQPQPNGGAADAGTVKIKLLADSRRQAHVYWGRKELGVAPLEIVRPRGSGPLDLTVLAPECLPLHTRVFTDRDDTLSLRLYTEREASGLPGYSVVAAPPSGPSKTRRQF